MMFALNSVGGVKIEEGGGGPYPLADLDRGFHFRQDTGGSISARTPAEIKEWLQKSI